MASNKLSRADKARVEKEAKRHRAFMYELLTSDRPAKKVQEYYTKEALRRPKNPNKKFQDYVTRESIKEANAQEREASQNKSKKKKD